MTALRHSQALKRSEAAYKMVALAIYYRNKNHPADEFWKVLRQEEILAHAREWPVEFERLLKQRQDRIDLLERRQRILQNLSMALALAHANLTKLSEDPLYASVSNDALILRTIEGAAKRFRINGVPKVNAFKNKVKTAATVFFAHFEWERLSDIPPPKTRDGAFHQFIKEAYFVLWGRPTAANFAIGQVLDQAEADEFFGRRGK